MQARRFLPGVMAAALLAGLPPASADRSPQTNYLLRCAGCHGMSGAGAPNAGIPDFRGKVGSLAMTQDGRLYLMHVPGVVGSQLSHREIAEVTNYLMQRWGGDSAGAGYQAFTEAEVRRLREENVADVVVLRRDVVRELEVLGLPVATYPWP
ncbi:cytochrome C-552 [Halomonas shantousis]